MPTFKRSLGFSFLELSLTFLFIIYFLDFHTISDLIIPLTFSKKMTGSPPYVRVQLLAEGPYRRVYFGMDSVKSTFQTITDLEFQHLSDTKKRKLLQNLSFIITRNLRHLNLAGYLGSSQNDASLTIISEFMIGQCTLSSYIKQHVKFELTLGSSIIRQILEGLAYLNENGLSMGSLNTTDIWIDVKGRVKLSNYGLFETTFQSVQTLCDRADIMALGGIVLEMFNGFPSENSPDNELAILDPLALSFVKECLST